MINIGAILKEAFMRLRKLLSKRSVLNLYRISAETELHTDASIYGYGAILLQKDNEDQHFHPFIAQPEKLHQWKKSI